MSSHGINLKYNKHVALDNPFRNEQAGACVRTSERKLRNRHRFLVVENTRIFQMILTNFLR